MAFDGKANVFFTLNPVKPDLLARANNRVDPRASNTTADLETQYRRWLFLDIDPDRPSGISSTEAEREAALAVLNEVVAFLDSQGWPAPITAMSGNGYYALYRVDLPNDAESTALLKEVLGTLAKRFDSPAAHVDSSVSNAARIIGLIGTLKVKGDETADRPHRRSCLISVPDQVRAVSIEQLKLLGGETEDETPVARRVSGGHTRSLQQLLEDHRIDYREQPADANGVAWYHVRRCPFHDDGRDFECGIGQRLPEGAFAGHCFHPEGQDKGWREWKEALGLRVGADLRLVKTVVSAPRKPTDFAKTDTGNAELFAYLYSDRLRYDHRRRRWLVWRQHHWDTDADGEVMRLAMEAVRQRYFEALLVPDLDERKAQAKFAIQSENRQRLEAMLALARDQLPLADRGDSWDADPFLLGVANGVVDLRTGDLHAGHPTQGITTFTPVRFDPRTVCPRWLQFLDEIFSADAELIDFIWRATGYSLAGDTSEQCVFACYGTGANGKSVLLSIMRRLAGAYAYNAPFSVFELQNRATLSNDVAPIAGARLVTSSETNEGTRINEARLKALTGSDPITARFLYGENFTFYPQAKFWLAVNHQPKVEDQSHGFWRRVRLIPFRRTFEADRDNGLESKLIRELPGILAWAVLGCLEWQRRGLQPPAVVTAATEAYRTESDPLAGFLEECCVTGSDLIVGSTEAYRAYCAWAGHQGLRIQETLSLTVFGRRMSGRFTKGHAKAGNVYRDVGLLSDRVEAPSLEASVKGSVKGFESVNPDCDNSPSEECITREVTGKAFTTLHPSPAGVTGREDGPQ